MITLDQVQPEYDAIVIGGGIGGMTAANRLGKFGRKVLLVEQHFELGGMAAYFKRGDNIFDTALHGFPVGMIKTCRKYWSKEMADCIIKLDTLRYDNPQFQVETSFEIEDFKAKLRDYFKVPAETVEEFFKTCWAMDFYDDQKMTTRELFEKFFPGRTDIMRFLLEPISYANGSTFDEPAITFGIVFSNFMSKGIFFFQGGTDKFIRMCREIMEKNDVDVLMRSRADRILVENGKVCGVEVNGKSIRGKSVISNANLKDTVVNMIGEKNLPGDFVANAKAMRLSSSVSQVYLGIKPGIELPYIGDLIFHSTAPEFSPETYLSYPPKSQSFSIYYPKSRPGYNRCAIASSMGAKYSDWSGYSAQEYVEAKERMIEDTIDLLESKYVPNIREIVDRENAEAATPITFERYTLHPGGATFGSKFEGLKISEGLPKALPGAYHTGSAAIIMSGWLGAANYGVIVANQVEEYVDKL